MAERQADPSRIVEGITPWLLVAFAVLAASGALLRISNARLLGGLDNTTLLYLGVAGALLLLRQVKSFSFGDYKLEMLEKVKEKQAQQEDQIEEFKMMLPFLLPKTERIHLLMLAQHQTGGYKGNHSLRAELRRLRSIGLIGMRPDQQVRYLKDGSPFDLATYVELTDLGKRWVRRIQEIEKSDSGPEETMGG